MSVLLVGISHQTAPVSVLERLALDPDGVAKLIHDLLSTDYVTEAIVVSTCNRVEIYVEVDRFHGSVEDVSLLLTERAGTERDDVVRCLYVHYDDAAVAHLFSVVSGLDSMVVGEGQILAQIRIALQWAQQHDSVGPALNALFQQALRVGKRGHAETGIDRAAPTLVGVALDLVGHDVSRALTESTRALVIGAGAMASLSAHTLFRRGVRDVVVANRTHDRARRLAKAVGGRAVRVGDVRSALSDVDLVISCTGAIGTVLSEQTVAAVTAQRSSTRPLTIIDLAMPRDVEIGAGQLPGVRLIDLQQLAVATADAELGDDIARVRAIVAEEVSAFLSALSASRVTPTVVALRTMATDVVDAEVRRLEARLPGLDERSRAEVARTLHRVADKLLHAPTVRVKELAATTGAVSYAEALADLFALDSRAVRRLTQPSVTGANADEGDT